VSLWAPKRVVAERYGKWVYTDLGLRVRAADDRAFEVRANRADDYKTPIETTWTSGADSGTFPTGIMPNFSGLPDLTKTVIRSVKTGKVVRRIRLDACFGYGAQRVRPEAPATSPYADLYGCPWNPYTLGSVMGIQAGWVAPMAGEGWSLRVPRGRYDVTSRITAPYRTSLGLSATEGVATTRLVVKKGSDDRRRQHRPRPAKVAQAAAHAPVGPSAVPPPGSPAPDLRSLPAWEIQLNRQGTALRFAATVWNAGNSPLVVDGFRSEEHPDEMDAYQYFFDADGNQVDYKSVGEMHWHAQNHQHWHFEDFARYRLLNADLTQAVRSTKQSFCLANTDAVDYTVEGADWNPENTDLSTSCGGGDALSVRQVLSSGSGDTYLQYRYGQAFRIDKVPNGIYYISIEANPFGDLYELDETNNQSLRKIKLSGKGEKRRVKVWPVGIVDESSAGFGFLREQYQP
jgi:hypothetical protein